MKLAFIADIHGNATALEAVLADIGKRNVNQVFVLGDLCYRGMEPNRSLEVVRSLDAQVIKGNADEWIIRGIKEGEVPEQVRPTMDQELAWTVSNLNRESIEYLNQLPTDIQLEFSKAKIHAFHATPVSLFQTVLPDEKDEVLMEKLMKQESDIYIYAHIHKPFIRYINGKCVINTGSVGLPFDGLNKASYAIVDIHNETVKNTIVRVAYDVDHVIKQFEESDYPSKKLIIEILKKSSI